jgi:hypothetical protein
VKLNPQQHRESVRTYFPVPRSLKARGDSFRREYRLRGVYFGIGNFAKRFLSRGLPLSEKFGEIGRF